MAYGPARSRSQDVCGFPQGQWPCDLQGVRTLRRGLPRDSLLTKASVAIDGSKFKAVNNRDRTFTRANVERRRAQLEGSVARCLSQLDTADRQEPSETLALKTASQGETRETRK